LDQTQLLQLADALRIAGPMELAKLTAPFAAADDEAVGTKLVENLKTAKARSSLRVEALQPIISKYPESVQHEADALYAMLNADAGKQKEHLDQLLAELPKGDIRHGQAIFNNPKVACSSCHEIGYLGGHVGPDLTAVGTVRTERDLLESIVYPSASFVRSFEPMVVLTKDGEQYNGIVRKDTADEVVLVTGAQTEAHVPRAEIQEMHPGTISVMPQGLADQLSKQELADLLAFLKNTKWGPQ
jgi:putative heme-binding domain-containing protein